MSRLRSLNWVRVFPVIGFLPACLCAQFLDVPLKNWAAPIYYQPALPDQSSDHARVGSERFAQSAPSAAGGLPSGPMVLIAVPPCRLVETRSQYGFTGPYGPPAIPPGDSSVRTVPVPGRCGVPVGAQAFSVNLTVVPDGGPLGYITLYPTGMTRPVVSTLTNLAGVIVSNAAIVPGDNTGSFNIYVTNSTHVVIDINGYYLPPAALALGAGTAGAPALTFSNDANSGVYSPLPGTVSVAASGTERLRVDSTGIGVTGNVDLTGDILKGGAYLLRADSSNIAAGLSAGFAGAYNTALGPGALQSLTADDMSNTALGYNAGNKIGNGYVYSNTAVGSSALANMTSGCCHTAVGAYALALNTGGSANTAVGLSALHDNVSGIQNTALGSEVGFFNTGSGNTFIGWKAARSATGDNNIVLGWNAGAAMTTGNYNIVIGALGVAGESNTVRIGDGSQFRMFLTGTRGVTTGNANAIPVVIDSAGQLGTVSSSRRVKRDIEDMGDTTSTIMSLRPVRFRYTAHGPEAPRQYGLVAEEVAEVAPDLVARKDTGEVETVFYDKVNAMLLNEVQKLHGELQRERNENRKLGARLTAIEASLSKQANVEATGQ